LAELAFSEHELFIGAITNSVFYSTGNQLTINFGFPASLFVSNQGQSPTHIEMDFASASKKSFVFQNHPTNRGTRPG
ncbi:MAG: hypothetical protein JJU02_07505, partial [Cryomorphaceae bacterium]|nr:hypothetical protein [Cryomorphaceae bacterium]